MSDSPSPQDLVNMQGAEGSLSGLMSILNFIPKSKRSGAVLVFVKFITDWFKAKKQSVTLEGDEETLSLMFELDEDALIMVPVTVDSDNKMPRILLEQGINVSIMATKVDPIEFMTIMMSSKESGDVRTYQQLLAMLRTAAAHPDCRLTVSKATAETEPVEYSPSQAAKVVSAAEVEQAESDADEVMEIDWDDEPLAVAIRKTDDADEIQANFPNGYVEILSKDNRPNILVPKGLTEDQIKQLLRELFESESETLIPYTEDESDESTETAR